MKKYALLIAGLFVIAIIHAQEKKEPDTTSANYIEMNELVLSANKFSEKKKNVVQKVDVITAAYINKINAQNTGDLLLSTGKDIVCR